MAYNIYDNQGRKTGTISTPGSRAAGVALMVVISALLALPLALVFGIYALMTIEYLLTVYVPCVGAGFGIWGLGFLLVLLGTRRLVKVWKYGEWKARLVLIFVLLTLIGLEIGFTWGVLAKIGMVGEEGPLLLIKYLP